MHHFNEMSLKACFHQLDGRKAVGVDGVTKAAYAHHLDDNLTALVARMKRMAYRPSPVRQVLIPKAGAPHATRPLGISNLEDKVVQLMMHRVLESIYEPLFLDGAYGFRPGRGGHDALRTLHQHLYRQEVETIIDCEIASYFDTIDHDLFETILPEKMQAERFMRYVKRMFKAGVLTAGELKISEGGVPQDSCCSPILANIGGVLNVEIRHSMPPINSYFIDGKTFGRNRHLHFQTTTQEPASRASASPRRGLLRHGMSPTHV